MASDYGGKFGGQPRPGARPPYPGQHEQAEPPGWAPQPQFHPQSPGAPSAEAAAPPSPPSWRARRRGLVIAVAILVVGALGLAAAAIGVTSQVMPRHFTAAQQRQITNWEYGARWRALPAGTIFPATVSYAPPVPVSDDPGLKLTARRVGVARQAGCASATDRTAAGVLGHDGCAAVLRATYVDGTGSYVLTVGAAVMPGTAQATAAAKGIDKVRGSGGLGSTVRTVQFGGTPAASFTAARRQLSGAVARGSYVVLYTVGYSDNRPREPVTGDSYTDQEMTSAGSGVARAVASVLAAPVTPAHCPGAPGC